MYSVYSSQMKKCTPYFMHVHVIHSSRTKGGKDGLLGNR